MSHLTPVPTRIGPSLGDNTVRAKRNVALRRAFDHLQVGEDRRFLLGRAL